MLRPKFYSLALMCSLLALPSNLSAHNKQLLFRNKAITEQDFRIPAIVLNTNGELIAFADRRYSRLGGDIGYGEIDIQNRISTDNGATWTGDVDNPPTIIDGIGGEGFDCAHGDAAVVCDSETGEILLMAASGSLGYPDGGVQIGRYYSNDGGRTFTGGEMTSGLPERVAKKKFFSSGRICQSSKIKVGTHYRIYSGLCTGNGSEVAYSDDFGKTWNMLGEPIANGNECKVEELPDGNLLLSCRISGRVGRMFSVFTYTDKTTATGSWSKSEISEGMTAASCNGEVLLVPTIKPDTYVLLQSVARSNERQNVSIYWKILKTTDPYTDPTYYHSWDGYYEISTISSCYSTMVLDRNGNIAFLWEENNTNRDYIESYDIHFQTLTLTEITSAK